MKSKRLYVILFLCVTTWTNATAKTVTLLGLHNCGEWIAGQGLPNGYAARNWLMGYLSGLSMGSATDFLTNIDGDSIFLWMNNYCRENPLNSITDGADVLSMQLLSKKKEGMAEAK